MEKGRIKQVFLGWDKPLVELATQRVAEEMGLQDGILDYSKVLFFLPTSQSCRRFRCSVTSHAVANNAVVFPGGISPLSSLISNIENQDTVVNSSTSFMVWVDVLREAPLKNLQSLFPLEVENQSDIRWRIGLAEKMFALQNRLGEVGLTIPDVAEMDVEEIDRWTNLAELEGEYLSRLENAGLTELNRAKRGFNTYSFPGVDRIIVAGVPDPLPLLVEKFKLIAEKIPVEIWIHAPESDSDKFDEYGRPIEQYWHDAHTDIPNESLIHLEGTSRQQGEEVVEILKKLQNREKGTRSEIQATSKQKATNLEGHACHGRMAETTDSEGINADDFAICIANEELYSDISYAFFRHGIHVYDPSGMKMAGMSVYHLLNNLFELVNKKDFESLSQLIRNPDYLRYFIRRSGTENVREIFSAVDGYLADHMSTLIHSLPEFEEEILKELVSHSRQLLKEFKSESFPAFIRRFLSDTFESLEFSPHTREEDHIFCSAANQVDRLLKELESPLAEKLDKTDLFEVFIRLLAKGTVYPERPEESLDLQGWLEISWEKSQNIIISGMNEGWLPESVVGDVFLPDSMLSKLGLNDNRKRFSRDTYILHSLLKSRGEGSVHMIVGKQNRSSDPIKPSRLLFKCDKEKLIERSEHLFSDVPEDIQQKKAEGAIWKLEKPQLNQEIKRISVTEFRNYLACPFRFYLKKCLGMDDVIYENNEMDARDFGTITHAVLEDFGNAAALSESSNAKEIKEFLDNNAETQFSSKFGDKDEWPLPILVQYESLKQRFAKFAEIQAEQVSEGWKIIETELKIGKEINGIYISGKIDRIEENTRNGKIRILDYKTVDSGDIRKLSPANVHLKRAGEDAPECAVFEYDGKNRCWIDLQLPIYMLLLKDKEGFKSKEFECGYFNLHKTVSHTGIYLWEDMKNYLEGAEECVGKVLENVNNKVFWPPSEKVQYENFERIYAGYNTLQKAFE